jgi:hypothetical protein
LKDIVDLRDGIIRYLAKLRRHVIADKLDHRMSTVRPRESNSPFGGRP